MRIPSKRSKGVSMTEEKTYRKVLTFIGKVGQHSRETVEASLCTSSPQEVSESNAT
jgi:hypothetical protein